MLLSGLLKEKINKIVESYSLRDLAKESEKLSEHYRHRDSSRFLDVLSSDRERLAYLIARLPATYAAGYQTLMEMQRRMPEEKIESFLDVGAGPGTLFLAALEAGLPLRQVTLIERDRGFIQLGQKLCPPVSEIPQEWVCQDLKNNFTFKPHDLVVASYVLNEMNGSDRNALLTRLWEVTQKVLIIIEPGTRAGFESLKAMREHLLLQGAHLVAPCPHSERCPSDWCHFSARIERTSLHRKIKDATLNYEDEKFCYLIFSKKKIESCQARVIRHPYKGSGFIKLQLCSKNGIEEKTLTKKNKQNYLSAKKIEWGDEFTIDL